MSLGGRLTLGRPVRLPEQALPLRARRRFNGARRRHDQTPCAVPVASQLVAHHASSTEHTPPATKPADPPAMTETTHPTTCPSTRTPAPNPTSPLSAHTTRDASPRPHPSTSRPSRRAANRSFRPRPQAPEAQLALPRPAHRQGQASLQRQPDRSRPQPRATQRLRHRRPSQSGPENPKPLTDRSDPARRARQPDPTGPPRSSPPRRGSLAAPPPVTHPDAQPAGPAHPAPNSPSASPRSGPVATAPAARTPPPRRAPPLRTRDRGDDATVPGSGAGPSPACSSRRQVHLEQQDENRCGQTREDDPPVCPPLVLSFTPLCLGFLLLP